MDEKLLGQALQYHGLGLLYSLKAEHQKQPSASLLASLDRKQHRDPEIKDAEFQKRVCTFIGRKSDMLFKSLSEEEKNRRRHDHEIIDDGYAIMPPLETFLDGPSHLRRGHFYKSLRPNDCVSGVVLSVLENGLRIQLLCVDKGCARDIDDLEIQAFCPVKELPKLYPNESALDAFQEKDIVRGIVLAVSEESEKIIISLHEKAIPDKNIYPRIGLITEQEFPVHYRRKKQIEGMPFNEVLHSILGFNNTGNVKALVEQLGIQEDSSYMRYLAGLHIPENEYAEGLRKWQSQKLAYHSVAQGVDMFKSGKFLEALQFFNRALQIDTENVEALVARGALYANNENFNHAVKDFEAALSINPNHKNAKKYLIETLLAFGKTCEDKRNHTEAAVHYCQVLKLDPGRVEARDLLEACQRLMYFILLQDEHKIKKEGDSEASVLSKSADKLRQLIQEDKKQEMNLQLVNMKKKFKKRSFLLSYRTKKQRRQSAGSSEKSKRRKRSDSSSSSSSSEDRRRHKKESRY
ncbi:unnamed protein product, partial [Candidula unifasciata]